MKDSAGGDDNTARIRLYLLGAFTATVDGQPLATPPAHVQALLAALCLRPRPWQRARLAGLLFPEVPEPHARRRLSHTLWQAKRWLPDLPLPATPETVHLAPDGLWIDLDAFAAAAAGARPEDWLRALEHYGGDLLEGIYDDWLLEEREALYLRSVDLSHRVCDDLWQQGRVEELLPIAERLVAREPLDERALRTLMRAYQALGRRGAALAAFERCAAELERELGVAPAPATRAVAEALGQALAMPAAFRHAASEPLASERPASERPASERPASERPRPPTPQELRRAAQLALARGEATRVRASLAEARRTADADPAFWRDVELDLALLTEDYARAEALLADLAPADLGPAFRLRAARAALGRQDAVAARDLAAQVVMQSPPADVEVDALLLLAEAQQHLGDRGYAAQSIERAAQLARRRGDGGASARALLLRGEARIRQGRYDGAGECFREARAVALEAGLAPSIHLAAALRGLRLVRTHTNDLIAALATVSEELGLWRDLGLPRQEAAALEGRALIENHLGRSAASLATMQQALAISRRLGDPVRIGISLYNLAASRIYHDDGLAPDALADGREALTIFSTHNLAHWEAAARSILGYILWVDGQHAAALDHLRDALAARERLGELAFVPELLAYQGLAYLGLDRPGDALALTQRAMMLLAHGGVSQEVVPELLYAHAAALATYAASGQTHAASAPTSAASAPASAASVPTDAGAADADRYLRQAYARLLDGAAAFDDEPARQAYFHRNPTMRRLMSELQSRGIAPPTGAGVRTVHLSGIRGGIRTVRWTVDTGPADAALARAEGPIALRRARLARLLVEAQSQGARPTVAELAAALRVSARTIRRDLAAQREAPSPPPSPDCLPPA